MRYEDDGEKIKIELPRTVKPVLDAQSVEQVRTAALQIIAMLVEELRKEREKSDEATSFSLEED